MAAVLGELNHDNLRYYMSGVDIIASDWELPITAVLIVLYRGEENLGPSMCYHKNVVHPLEDIHGVSWAYKSGISTSW